MARSLHPRGARIRPARSALSASDREADDEEDRDDEEGADQGDADRGTDIREDEDFIHERPSYSASAACRPSRKSLE